MRSDWMQLTLWVCFVAFAVSAIYVSFGGV
jgi:hypothetical protein